jgi:dehydrogenase/reductase SDR family member 12
MVGNKSKVSLEVVDISRPTEIKNFCARTKKVDILVNNAGVLLGDRSETPDGIETTFATNTLGVYFMTELLVPLLEASKGRVVTVSSGKLILK